MRTHNINYDGVDYEVTGEWDSEDETTGYKGGFSWMQIHINGMDVSQHILDCIIERLCELVVEENY